MTLLGSLKMSGDAISVPMKSEPTVYAKSGAATHSVARQTPSVGLGWVPTGLCGCRPDYSLEANASGALGTVLM